MLLVAGLTAGEITYIATKDRQICIKTHTKASTEYEHELISHLPRRVSLLQTIIHDMISKGSEFENTGVKKLAQQ
jgi:hypothetical protein